MGLITGEYGFLRWWAYTWPQAIVSFGKRTVALVGDTFAIVEMVKHLAEPIFQDLTWQGRLIGIFIRFIRIGVGLFGQAIMLLLTGVMLILWYLLPLIAVWGMLL